MLKSNPQNGDPIQWYTWYTYGCSTRWNPIEQMKLYHMKYYYHYHSQKGKDNKKEPLIEVRLITFCFVNALMIIWIFCSRQLMTIMGENLHILRWSFEPLRSHFYFRRRRMVMEAKKSSNGFYYEFKANPNIQDRLYLIRSDYIFHFLMFGSHFV